MKIWQTLIEAPELKTLLSPKQPHCLVLDISFDLNDVHAGQAQYAHAHIPGSFYLHLDHELSGVKSGSNGRHPLPSRENFAQSMSQLGLRPDTQVVVLDRQGGMFAVRAWWMLRWIGHAPVAVLNGGFAAWQAAGGAVTEATTESPQPHSVVLKDSLVRLQHIDDVHALLQGQHPHGQMLLDARPAERYRGEVEPLDPVAGHIPGALNRPFKENLQADGRFKSADVLRAEFSTLLGSHPPEEVVHQCGSGVTACHNLLAMEVAGLTGAALYAGSWSEWCADPKRPVAVNANAPIA